MTSRAHDLVVYGATGFVGRLVAGYLAERAAGSLRVGLAGRSRERLQAVREQLPAAAGEWPLLVADSADGAALAELAAASRVLVSTVGPYLRYGMPVVEACARAGTHYADLTGEVLFHRQAIDRVDATARDSGARIVHSCGYDSVPSDLGVLLLAERARELDAGGLTDVLTIATARGGVSGGTVDSMRGQFEAVRRNPALRRILGDPHSLSPDRASEPTVRQPADSSPPGRRGPDGGWTAPFVMASYNTRVVRRSNALQDHAYGRDLRYGEVMGLGTGPRGAVAAAGVTAVLAGLVDGVQEPTAARGAGPGAAETGQRTECPDPDPRVVPDGHRGRHAERPRVARDRVRVGRPRLRGHRGDAGRERAVPGRGRRAAARPVRLPDPGHRPGRRAGRAAPGGRAHVPGHGDLSSALSTSRRLA